jgi:hypothetical protein
MFEPIENCDPLTAVLVCSEWRNFYHSALSRILAQGYRILAQGLSNPQRADYCAKESSGCIGETPSTPRPASPCRVCLKVLVAGKNPVFGKIQLSESTVPRY